MKSLILGTSLAYVLAVIAVSAAMAADHEAGVPLTPAEAVGTWSVESAGHTLCTVKLGAEKTRGGAYALQVPASCQGTLPDNLTGWMTTSDGMGLTGADGQTLIKFNRWSNSLFVSHTSSGIDVQLRRGGPGAG
jgi:hypothetical protein